MDFAAKKCGLNIMGSASHGSSRPVRICPFDLITLYHFVYIFHFFFRLFILLYVTCVMVNKAVKKKNLQCFARF